MSAPLAHLLAVQVGTANPFTGIGHMLALPFEVRAYIVGSLIAAAAGLVGFFVVLRSQVFTGDALSHVAFTGALAALAAGVDLRVGLFAACVIFGAAMAALGRAGRADDVVIGSVFAWILGLGVFFLTIYTTGASATGNGNNGSSGVNVLFGSIFGLTVGQTDLAAVIAAAVIVAILAIARPLLFASIDPAVAAARGVPVTALGVGFLVLVGVTAGEATQAVGALLPGPASTAARDPHPRRPQNRQTIPPPSMSCWPRSARAGLPEHPEAAGPATPQAPASTRRDSSPSRSAPGHRLSRTRQRSFPSAVLVPP